MSIMESRGGAPHVFRDTIDNSAGRMHQFPFVSKHLQVRAASNPCKLYFTEEDFTADANYVVVPVASTSTPNGEWVGPVEASKIWLKGSGGSSTIELVAFQRRG
jgi:hypothetical protein